MSSSNSKKYVYSIAELYDLSYSPLVAPPEKLFKLSEDDLPGPPALSLKQDRQTQPHQSKRPRGTNSNERRQDRRWVPGADVGEAPRNYHGRGGGHHGNNHQSHRRAPEDSEETVGWLDVVPENSNATGFGGFDDSVAKFEQWKQSQKHSHEESTSAAGAGAAAEATSSDHAINNHLPVAPSGPGLESVSKQNKKEELWETPINIPSAPAGGSSRFSTFFQPANQQPQLQPQSSGIQGIQSHSIPQTSIPQTGIPQTGMPQTGMPQTSIPQGGIPQTGMPQTGIPQTSIPQGGIPQGGIPQTSIPGLAHSSSTQSGFSDDIQNSIHRNASDGIRSGTPSSLGSQTPLSNSGTSGSISGPSGLGGGRNAIPSHISQQHVSQQHVPQQQQQNGTPTNGGAAPLNLPPGMSLNPGMVGGGGGSPIAIPPGMMRGPSAMAPPGMVPPGMGPPPPGMVPPGMVPPGMRGLPPGMMPPGMMAPPPPPGMTATVPPSAPPTQPKPASSQTKDDAFFSGLLSKK